MSLVKASKVRMLHSTLGPGDHTNHRNKNKAKMKI